MASNDSDSLRSKYFGRADTKAAKGPEFRAREEKFPLLGATGRALQSVDEFARKPFGYENPPAAIISDLMQIPALTRTIENINYGSPLTYGTGTARQLSKDTKGAAEAALNLAPAAGPLVRATKNMPIGMVVKPVGNLNLRPSVLATALKGPEKQKVGDFIKQINGMKGLTKEGKEGALASLKAMDQNQVVTKQFVEDSFTPSKYNLVDLKGAADDPIAHLEVEAQRMVDEDPDIFEKFAEYMELTSHPKDAALLEELVSFSWDNARLKDAIKQMSPDTKDLLTRRGILDDAGKLDKSMLQNYYDEFNHQMTDTNLEYLRTNYEDLYPGGGDYAYGDYQRLINPRSGGSYMEGYVEKGVAHPEARPGYRHFPESEENLVAHFRGTSNPPALRVPVFTDEFLRTGGGKMAHEIPVDPNAFVIEELQSDAAKRAGASGILHQPHATAFKAAIQHALEQGHDTVYMPTARTIGFARNTDAAPYTSIYDQEVVNYGIAPLSRVKGVEIEPVMFEDLEEFAAPAYHKIRISPEAREELLEGMGQSLPGFAGGGSVEASPFEGLEPTFGNRMGAYISDKITEAGINLYDMLANREGMSAAHKIYLDTFARNRRDPITAKDFDEAELAELQNIIAQKEAATGGRGRGSIRYKDYDELPGGDRRRASGASLIGGRMPPRPSLSKSLGQFGYGRDAKTGEYKIRDEYDFNPQQITYEGRKVDVPVEHYGDYMGNTLSPFDLARLYAGRKMPPGTGRKVDLSVTATKPVKKADGGAIDFDQLRSKYFGSSVDVEPSEETSGFYPDANDRMYALIRDSLPNMADLQTPTLAGDVMNLDFKPLSPVAMV
jgi:hypothetical protein